MPEFYRSLIENKQAVTRRNHTIHDVPCSNFAPVHAPGTKNAPVGHSQPMKTPVPFRNFYTAGIHPDDSSDPWAYAGETAADIGQS